MSAQQRCIIDPRRENLTLLPYRSQQHPCDKILVMQAEISPTFTAGGIPVYGDTILAPMDGYSDLPFRSLTRRMGSAMSYTQFISAKAVINGRPDVKRHLTYRENERPVVFQLYGEDPQRLLRAAQIMRQHNPDMIDLNLGCSSRAVVARGAGAGLLQSPGKIAKIMQTLTQNLDIPVSAKIRIGWDEGQRNYLEIARVVQDNGGALLAVHARTMTQGYRTHADWQAIAEVKAAVNIPVIGNGDVSKAADIARMKSFTGCDAVMIGRAAIGNPWIFARLERDQVSPQQVHETMLQHLESMLDFYGLEDGLIRFRKHAKRYLKLYELPKDLLREMLTSESPEQFIQLLGRVFELEAVQ
jgi:tRNA-dihydrouridine synthase B